MACSFVVDDHFLKNERFFKNFVQNWQFSSKILMFKKSAQFSVNLNLTKIYFSGGITWRRLCICSWYGTGPYLCANDHSNSQFLDSCHSWARSQCKIWHDTSHIGVTWLVTWSAEEPISRDYVICDVTFYELKSLNPSKSSNP